MSLLENVLQQFSGPALSALSGQLGANESQTQSAIANALPILVSALSNNASNGSGASALANALDADHDGSILDDVMGFVTNGAGGGMGAGILKHLLGGQDAPQQNAAAAAVSQTSGLSMAQVGSLLMTLAPIVMAYLGKKKQEEGLDANGVASLLKNEQETHAQSGGVLGMLSGFLDADKDGSALDDIAGMLGKFMK
jgi:hypothetical protein